MSRLFNSKLFNGDYNEPEPMGIVSGLKNNQVYNDLYYNAVPRNISKDLITDPIITESFKPPFEPSINRDKMRNYSKYPYTDTDRQYNTIPPYWSPQEFTPKCRIIF